MNSAAPESDIWTLFCVVSGDISVEHAFPVNVKKKSTIGELKKLIKDQKAPEFDDIAADKLTLRLVNLHRDELATFTPDAGVVMSPLDNIEDVFSEEPRHKHIHVVVFRSMEVGKSPYSTRYSANLQRREYKSNLLVTGLKKNGSCIFILYI